MKCFLKSGPHPGHPSASNLGFYASLTLCLKGTMPSVPDCKHSEQVSDNAEQQSFGKSNKFNYSNCLDLAAFLVCFQ